MRVPQALKEQQARDEATVAKPGGVARTLGGGADTGSFSSASPRRAQLLSVQLETRLVGSCCVREGHETGTLGQNDVSCLTCCRAAGTAAPAVVSGDPLAAAPTAGAIAVAEDTRDNKRRRWDTAPSCSSNGSGCRGGSDEEGGSARSTTPTSSGSDGGDAFAHQARVLAVPTEIVSRKNI